MKTSLFILLSIIVHLALGISLWRLNDDQPTALATEIVDLTLNSRLQMASEKVAQPPSTKPTTTAKAATLSPLPATSSLDGPESSAPEEDSSSGENTLASGTESFDGALLGIGEVTRLPKVTGEVKATYPPEAKEARIEGPVILDVIIDRRGKVAHVALVRGPGYGLNESAIDALRRFEFSPAQKGDTPVAVKIRYTYRFKLGIN